MGISTETTHPARPHPTSSLIRVAASATLHCLTGCAIGEVLGFVILPRDFSMDEGEVTPTCSNTNIDKPEQSKQDGHEHTKT
jgi:hypothetical protein